MMTSHSSKLVFVFLAALFAGALTQARTNSQMIENATSAPQAAEQSEAQCRSEAKAQATRIYRSCMRVAQGQRLHQLKEDYQARLKQLQQEYEAELKSLSGESASSIGNSSASQLNATSNGQARSSARQSQPQTQARQQPRSQQRSQLRSRTQPEAISAPTARLDEEFQIFDSAEDAELPEPVPVENVPLVGR